MEVCMKQEVLNQISFVDFAKSCISQRKISTAEIDNAFIQFKNAY